jgi:hypothetical protein
VEGGGYLAAGVAVGGEEGGPVGAGVEEGVGCAEGSGQACLHEGRVAGVVGGVDFCAELDKCLDHVRVVITTRCPVERPVAQLVCGIGVYQPGTDKKGRDFGTALERCRVQPRHVCA